MDILLQKVTQQAMNYAIRSGIAITSGYAINQCTRLLKTVEPEERDELGRLQRRLDSKIRIIAPAIDMIELIAARGNTSLESAVNLTKSIRFDIQALGVRLSRAAAEEESARRSSSRATSKEQTALELKLIIKDIKRLLDRIEDAVPFINLAITTSGVSLSTNLPPTISPSRLLQASTFLSAGDSHYGLNPGRSTQIGPRFTLSVYMLFLGHSHHALDEEGLSKTVWKEVIHKAQMKLVRVPLGRLKQFPFLHSDKTDNTGNGSEDLGNGDLKDEQIPTEIYTNEFAYQLTLVEDLEDDRVHTFEDEEAQPDHIDDVKTAGIRTFVPIHEVAKIFYADTGKILNLGSEGEANNPILLLKRDVNAPAPRRLIDRTEADWDLIDEVDQLDAESSSKESSPATPTGDADARSKNGPRDKDSVPGRWGLPPDLDPEWIALEVYNEEYDSDEDSETEAEESSNASPPQPLPSERKRNSLAAALSNLRLTSTPTDASDSRRRESNSVDANTSTAQQANTLPLGASGPIVTSLSLLEMLIRLASLQQFQQCSHLAITDELLNFFLSEGSTTGAAPGDAEARKRIRMEARQHVGFDPYDESPVKRRGEQYQVNGDSYGDGTSVYEQEYAMSSPLRQPPSSSAPQSPLLLRSREHSSKSPTQTQRSTPPFPRSKARKDPSLPMTPPGTNKSRREALRHEAVSTEGSTKGRSSPLAKGESSSPESKSENTEK